MIYRRVLFSVAVLAAFAVVGDAGAQQSPYYAPYPAPAYAPPPSQDALGYPAPPPNYQQQYAAETPVAPTPRPGNYPPAGAYTTNHPDPTKVERLDIGFGIYNIDELRGWPLDTIVGLRNEAAFIGQLEYRGIEYRYGLAPMFGLSITTDRALYGYGGVNWNIHLGERWTIMPNFAAGLFARGNGQDLGGAIEFRSGIEVNARVGEASTVGISFSHMSNAGIYNSNPGEETLMLHYAVPVDLF